MTPKRLWTVASGNLVGARTGRQYEYQHEQAAFSALEMLARHDWQCVYCEWHDDFVVEHGAEPSVHYLFHQVKSKNLSQGPWSFHDLFGMSVPKSPKKKSGAAATKVKSKPLKVNGDAIFLRLLEHDKIFAASCGSFVFVTNTGIEPVASNLLDAVAAASDHASLSAKEKVLFEHLVRGYCQGNARHVPSEAELFAFLKRFAIAAERGNLKPEAALNEICDRVFEYSEIDLQVAERKQIARQLVQLIRTKATDYTVSIPIQEATLRSRKGVVVAEVLNVLSLSHGGYLALLQGGADKDLVRTLSRLERFCRTRKDLEPYLPEICAFKAKWDAWRTRHRHQIQDTDHVAVVMKSREIIASNKPLTEMISMAREAAETLSKSLPGGVSITGEDVLGIVFTLAAGAGTA